jgi:outer membrane murein-binding lipoprotein Lpp
MDRVSVRSSSSRYSTSLALPAAATVKTMADKIKNDEKRLKRIIGILNEHFLKGGDLYHLLGFALGKQQKMDEVSREIQTLLQISSDLENDSKELFSQIEAMEAQLAEHTRVIENHDEISKLSSDIIFDKHAKMRKKSKSWSAFFRGSSADNSEMVIREKDLQSIVKQVRSMSQPAASHIINDNRTVKETHGGNKVTVRGGDALSALSDLALKFSGISTSGSDR